MNTSKRANMILREMSKQLRQEVEAQLLNDMKHYGVHSPLLIFDYDAVITSGHETEFLDGTLRGLQDLLVRQQDGSIVARGAVDFVHGGGKRQLFVFWTQLRILDREMNSEKGIPRHVWETLPDSSRRGCANRQRYDAYWCDDPRVVKWARKNSTSSLPR